MKMLVFGLLALTTPACLAATITFDSSTSTTNNTSGPHYATVAATVDPSWATALPGSIWITTSNDKDPALGTTVTFTVDLDITGPFNLATLDLGVFADDSTTVMLDGTTLFTEDTTLGTHCAAGIVGCTDGTEGILNNVNVTGDVHDGMNTLTFEVFQEVNDTPFGTDFAGSLTTSDVTPTPTPEPGSRALLGSGLLGLAGLRRRFGKRG